MTEATLQRLLLARLNRLPGVWVWRNNTGAAVLSGHHVRFGLPGQADISGLIRGGRRLEIEVKGPRGRQSPEQFDFQSKIEELGGLYLLARDVEATLRAVRGAVEQAGHVDGLIAAHTHPPLGESSWVTTVSDEKEDTL